MANAEHERLAQLGAEEWNAWRKTRPNEPIDLIGADLRDVNLESADLHDAAVQTTNFRGAILAGANLVGAQAMSARFDNANLTTANVTLGNFSNASFDKATLRGAVAKRAIFKGATVRWASFEDADLESANLRDATLEEAKLRNAHLIKLDLRDANCSLVDFSRADLAGATFLRVSAIRANFESANLAFADFRGADMLDALLTLATVHDADFRSTRRLDCVALTRARDWQKSLRDPILACGADIPVPPAPGSNTPSGAFNRSGSVSAFGNRFILKGERVYLDQASTSSGEISGLVSICRRALYELGEALEQRAKGNESQLTKGAERGIGDNNPPESIFSDEAETQLRAEIGAGLATLDAPRPNRAILSGVKDAIASAASAIKHYLDEFATNASQEAGKQFGKWTIRIAAASAMYDPFKGAIEALTELIKVLPN